MDSIESPLAGTTGGRWGGYGPMRLEAMTPAERARFLDVAGVDRPLEEVALGWGEDAYIDPRLGAR